MRTRLDELLCSNDLAKFFMSMCLDERGVFVRFIYDWQTLIGRLIAVVAALIGGYLLWVQIGDQRKKDKQESSKGIRAALIPVPHALVEINKYLHGCFDAWQRGKPDDRPPSPAEALSVIMKAAPYVDDETFESFQQLVIKSQVFESRLERSGIGRPRNSLDTMIVDIAEYSYLTNRLIEYSRISRAIQSVLYRKADRNDLVKILKFDFNLMLCVAGDSTLERITKALGQRFPGESGWPEIEDL